MRKNILLLAFALLSVLAIAQNANSNANNYTNLADDLLSKDSRLVIGGYGEIQYNQPFDGDVRKNGTLDVPRLVMLLGYNFNKKTQFVSELEFEHVKEVYVEQAFLQHKLTNSVNLRGGLMLVPMGIVNEYHEPTTFNGVERPLIDNYIAPTTWREIGVGVTGNVLPASLKYQAYVMNGFNGYDGSGQISGKNGLRKGRQKGAESFISSPNFTGKIEYYGIRGLNIGLSGYVGKTQSTLYDGISKNDAVALTRADSSVIGIAMIGLDTRYNYKGFQLRGQFYYSNLTNTDQYNVFTAKSKSTLNDVGSSMIGYYAEVGYNVLRSMKTEMQLIPFVRYEFMNTQNSVENNITNNISYQKNGITTGLTLVLTRGVVAKADMQLLKSGNDNEFAKTLNMGIGVMF